VKLEVERNVGRITVREQSGRDVHVFVDGQDKGAAPWEGEISAGEHTVEAKGQRFASEARKITLASKERLEISLDAAALTGRLRVTTVPATASIRIDGKNVGTGAWEGELPEGTHRIEVAMGSEAPQVRDVSLARGQTIVQEIPVVSAIATGRVTDYVGMYVKVSIFGMIGLSGNPDNSTPALQEDGGFMGGFGGALRVGRAWDWWGIEGVGIFFFEHRNRNYKTPIQISGNPYEYSFKDQSDAVNGFLGVGARATSKDDSVRFTFGAAPGLFIRTLSPRRDQKNDGGPTPTGNNPNPGGTGNRFAQPSGTTSTPTTNQGCQPFCSGGGEDFQSSGYTSFGFAFDGGILVGSTPGTKFYFGLMALMDFAPTLTFGPDTQTPLPDATFAKPGRGALITDGMAFYIGPTLGLQFGH
jgi:hypothetical protein